MSTRQPAARRARKPQESGQALIVVVLLMLVIAGLAGLFIALVALQLARTARQADAIRAREYAQAAVRYAHYNLLYSPEGASWQPPAQSNLPPGVSRFGQGEWALDVSYHPRPGDPYSQFIEIVALGRPRARRFVQVGGEWRALDATLVRRAAGYVPIGVTDYIRWVTNPDKAAATTDLGVPLEVVADYPAYRTDFDGPIRVNGNLEWHSRVRLALWTRDPDGEYYRNDSVAVAGTVAHAQDPNFPPSVAVSVNDGSDRAVYPSDDAAFTTLGGRYRDGRRVKGRYVRRLEPPDLFQQRYLNLTRNTGYWAQDASNGNRYYKTGQYVAPYPGDVGDGLYVDNSTQVQSDYEALRDDLRDNWESGTYDPPGAEIELHPDDNTGTHGNHPYITITRHDAGFYQPNAVPGSEYLGSVEVLYPRNGVIFLEGNARVRGTLPPRAGSPGDAYYVDEDNRCFDLTIVSMGTIYIDENLLGPRSAGLTTKAEEDSKLALLARNSVVLLYVSRYGMRPIYSPYSLAHGCWEVQPGEPYEAWFALTTSTPPPNLKLLISHTGAENPATTGPGGQAIMNLIINGTRYDWSQGGTQSTRDDPESYYLFVPPPAWTANNETNAVAPVIEHLPDSGPTYDKTIILNPYLVDNGAGDYSGVMQRIRIEVPYDTARNYWLYKLAVPAVDIEVDAAIYAQRGSWFVLPGPWFNDDPNPLPAGTDPDFPQYHEPLDVMVTIKGAIAEGRAAPLSDVRDWVAHWRGSDDNWQKDTGTSDRALRYQFDPSLRAALDSAPRLQGLPVSPVLLGYGEHM